jgi:hypothetical protein
MSHGEELDEVREQSQRSLPKNLIHHLPVQDHWGWRFRRLALLIADARRQMEWSSLGDAAAEAAKPRCVGILVTVGVTTTVVATRIYREDPPMATTSHNRLGLSLSKCIRHGLVAKLNGKRRPWAYEALDWISVDYSCTRRAPPPITSPHHTTPRHARPGPIRQGKASERTCVFPFLLSSTHLQVHREQPIL